jgi:hypothetical protein
MEHVGGENEALRREIHELKLAVGLEQHKGTTETWLPQSNQRDTGSIGAVGVRSTVARTGPS